MSFDWKSLIKKIAPFLGAAIGGPLGSAAGTTLSAILGTPEGDEAALAQALASATPETLLAIKQADAQFKLEMEKLGINSTIELEKLAVDDRKDARMREIKTGDWMVKVLASIVVLGFLWAVWFVLSGRVSNMQDAATIGMIGTLIGYISAKADTIIGYYFGSSASSAKKDELLAKSIPRD